jgi:hypothetical protein
MKSDRRDEQFTHAYSPRVESVEPDSKLKSEKSGEMPKQCFEIVSPDDGIQIDWSDEQFSNAPSPKFETLEPDSNVKVKRGLQLLKQYLPIVPSDEGIQTD